jgi:hypothetical protein
MTDESDMIVPAFDYAQLDQPTQDALQHQAEQLRSLAQTTATNLWEMGQVLAEAQKRLAALRTGTFMRWVESETGLSHSTCYRLINVYKAFTRPTVGRITLSTTVLYLLAEPSTPPAARFEAIERSAQGETINPAKVQEIVQSYRPEPSPAPPPSPEYMAFEREQLRPRLRDAQDPAAPQVLSGAAGEFRPVPQEKKQEAAQSIREAIVEVVQGIDTDDPDALDECADQLLEILGQVGNSISVAARFGIELAQGPKTLSDLTSLCIWTCGKSMDGMDRPEHLRWRKRALRLVDAISYAGGAGIYQHTLANGQICLGIVPWEETGD